MHDSNSLVGCASKLAASQASWLCVCARALATLLVWPPFFNSPQLGQVNSLSLFGWKIYHVEQALFPAPARTPLTALGALGHCSILAHAFRRKQCAQQNARRPLSGRREAREPLFNYLLARAPWPASARRRLEAGDQRVGGAKVIECSRLHINSSAGPAAQSGRPRSARAGRDQGAGHKGGERWIMRARKHNEPKRRAYKAPDLAAPWRPFAPAPSN